MGNINAYDAIYLALLFKHNVTIQNYFLNEKCKQRPCFIRLTNEDLNRPYLDSHLFIIFDNYNTDNKFYSILEEFKKVKGYYDERTVYIENQSRTVVTFALPFWYLTECEKIKTGYFGKLQRSTVITILKFWNLSHTSYLAHILDGVSTFNSNGVKITRNEKGELINALNDPLELEVRYIGGLSKRHKTIKPEDSNINGLFIYNKCIFILLVVTKHLVILLDF